MEINWKTMRVKYELLGYSIEELAEEFELNPDAVQHMVESKGWVKKTDGASPLHNCTSTEQYLETLTGNLMTEFSIIALHHQQHIQPKFIQIELELVGKLRTAIESLDATLPSAASMLKRLTETLALLVSGSGLYKQVMTNPDALLNGLGMESDNFMLELRNAAQQLADKNRGVEPEDSDMIQ